MADYGLVPRALRGLAGSIERGAGRIAESKRAEGRLALEESRVGFEITKATEARTHREKVFDLKEPVLKEAAEQAKFRIGEGSKRVKFGELFRGFTPESYPYLVEELMPAFEKAGFSFPVDEPGTGEMLVYKDGKPYTQWQKMQDADMLTDISAFSADAQTHLQMRADAGDEDAAKILKEKDPEAITERWLKTLYQRKPYPGASPAMVEMWKTRVKYTEDKLKQFRTAKTKKEVARIKAEGQIPTIDGVKLGTKEERKEGNEIVTYRMTKKGWKEIARGPRKTDETGKKKPTATDFNSLRSLIDKTTDKGSREPTADQAVMINEAAQAIGYEFKQRTRLKKEKHWYWFDSDKKWVLVKKEEEPTRGISKAKVTPTEATRTAPPVNILREGTNTTFKNGQVWTLKGGVATFVGQTGKVKQKITE